MEEIPAVNSRGFYSKSQGRFLHVEDAAGEDARWMKNYEILQYNNMFDKRNKSELFFPYLKQYFLSYVKNRQTAYYNKGLSFSKITFFPTKPLI